MKALMDILLIFAALSISVDMWAETLPMTLDGERSLCYDRSTANVENELPYISEGTKWITVNYQPVSLWEVKEIRSETWIEGTETIEGVEYMKLWFSSEITQNQEVILNYIRTEDERVYMLPSGYESITNESLIYDFSLEPGETTQLKGIVPACFESDGDWQACCSEIRTRSTCGQDFQIMKMETHSLDGDESCIGWSLWIRGLGNSSGFFGNAESGNMWGTWLEYVYHNGTLIYDNTSGIDGIVNDEIDSNDGRKYHLDGTPFNDGDTGIYIQNGKKYFKSPNASK